MPHAPSQSQSEAAETLALQALGFIASDPARLADFIALTGITAEDLRQRAGHADVMAAALGQLMQDEAGLLMFCANAGIPPEDIGRAHAVIESLQSADGTK